jgi:hypothetical protein
VGCSSALDRLSITALLGVRSKRKAKREISSPNRCQTQRRSRHSCTACVPRTPPKRLPGASLANTWLSFVPGYGRQIDGRITRTSPKKDDRSQSLPQKRDDLIERCPDVPYQETIPMASVAAYVPLTDGWAALLVLAEVAVPIDVRCPPMMAVSGAHRPLVGAAIDPCSN